MTITRITQEAFELGSWADFDWVKIDTAPIFDAVSYTGGGCGEWDNGMEGVFQFLDSAITQIRTGFMFRVTSSVVVDTGLFFLASGSIATKVLSIYYDDPTHTWYAYAGATLLGSFVLDVIDSTWRNMGIDFKADASAGWCYVYIDGVAQISYEGQTDYGDSDFDIYGIGPISPALSGWNRLYIDDFYIDNTVGESVSNPPLKRFFYVTPDGNGNYAQWHGSDGDQVDNYELIDDVNESVYNMEGSGLLESKTSGHRDSWTLTASGLSGSDDIVAVIAHAFTKTRSVTDSVEGRVFLRHSSTDDDGDAATPPVNLANFAHRFILDPSGDPWTATVVDALELGIKFE